LWSYEDSRQRWKSSTSSPENQLKLPAIIAREVRALGLSEATKKPFQAALHNSPGIKGLSHILIKISV
jgi:hypothetical protein